MKKTIRFALMVLAAGCSGPALCQSVDGIQSDLPGRLAADQPQSGFRLTVLDRAPPPPARADTVMGDGRPMVSSGCDSVSQPVARASISRATASTREVYWSLVRSAECRYGLPPGLLDSIILQESRYSPLAVSRAGAAGLAQLMPATARAMGVGNRFDPRGNVEGGARYLRQLLDRFGSVPMAVAAYNAGPGAVSKARGIPFNRETPLYVQKVMGYFAEHMAATRTMMRQVAMTGF